MLISDSSRYNGTLFCRTLLLLLLLLSMMILITGLTCLPTSHFKFITKCDKSYYKLRQLICLGNSMICCAPRVIFQNCYTIFHGALGEWNLRQFWNIASGIYAKYHVQIMLLFVYTTTHERFVIFTCRYFKLSWNTTALSQSNCRNFSCSSIIWQSVIVCYY